MHFIENQTDLSCTPIRAARQRPEADDILTLEPGAKLRLEPFSVMCVRDRDGWEDIVTGAEPMIVTGPLVYTKPEIADEEKQIDIGRALRDANWLGIGTFVAWGVKVLIATLITAGLMKLFAGGAFTQHVLGVLPGVALGALLVDIAFLLLRKPGLAEARRIIASRSRLRTLTIDPANLRA